MKPPTMRTLTVFKKTEISHALCAKTRLELWKRSSDLNSNILALVALRIGCALMEERLPTEEARHICVSFSFLLVH